MSTWRPNLRSQRTQGPTRPLAGGIWLIVAFATLVLANPARGLPELWDQLCSSCHRDDTPSCAGCHNHRGELQARTERARYWPGERVRVIFGGGSEHGWIRALLYDASGNEVDRATGPTASGNDALHVAGADSVTFPVTLEGRAPSEPGSYEWRAAYFGIFHIQNVTHGEEWVSVPLCVADPDSALLTPSWGKLKLHYR